MGIGRWWPSAGTPGTAVRAPTRAGRPGGTCHLSITSVFTPSTDTHGPRSSVTCYRALAFGAFKYNRETHRATVGPMEMSVTEQRTVNIPVWAGVGAIVVGAVLLLARQKIEA